MDRAYSLIEIKSINEDERTIEGIATTPAPDRMGDIVEPLGAKFKLPLPLLWQHDAGSPVGQVESAKASKEGITVRAQIAKIEEPGALKDLTDKAWQALKANLVRGLSIGFSPIERSVMKDGGFRFMKWEWLELSLVTIPANAEASIQTIKSIDSELRAATTGTPQKEIHSVSAETKKPVVKARIHKVAKKTIAEQISAFEATRAAKNARMEEIMETAADEGATLDTEQKEEYDTLEGEVKEIDAHLVRLNKFEKANREAAKPIEEPAAKTAVVRAGGVVSVKAPEVPKGTAFTRYAMALAKSRGNLAVAAEMAGAWKDSTPEVEQVLRSAVAAGSTTDATWAGNLVQYQIMASEFVEYLRPQTIIGRIPGLRRVPFNVKMPTQTAGSSVQWVGQNRPKPLSDLAFSTISMTWAKAAGIVVLTDELVRFSNPAAEGLVRTDLAAAMAQFLDEQFIDPSVSVVANVSPASITQGAPNDSASGVDADALRADVKAAFESMLGANISPNGSIWIMQPSQALALAMMLNPLGQQEFPGVTVDGGVLFGLPVVTSESAGSGQITLLKPSEILLADDGQVTLDVSREASLRMSDDPSGDDPDFVSLWQNNLVALRAERYINWLRRRTQAVYYITSANYGGASS